MSVREALGSIAFSLLLAAWFLIASCHPASAQGIFDKAYTASEWGVFTGHIYDGFTTQRAIAEGHREANPLLLRNTDPLVMASLKAAGAIGTVYLTRKVKASGHRWWALATNVGTTSVLLVVANQNNDIIQRGRVKQ